MKRTLTGTLEFDDQGVHLILSEPAERAVLTEVARAQREAEATARANQEALMRTYHLGDKPTPGRGYDDRLKMRLGCGTDTARELVSSGRIRHQYLGNRYSIEEQAIRDLYATLPATGKLRSVA